MPTDPSADKSKADSQSGETSLPVFDVPSEGDIDLAGLESRVGDEVPLAAVPPPAPPLSARPPPAPAAVRLPFRPNRPAGVQRPQRGRHRPGGLPLAVGGGHPPG